MVAKGSADRKHRTERDWLKILVRDNITLDILELLGKQKGIGYEAQAESKLRSILLLYRR